MLDSNNNPSPKVFATKSNLPVPTMRVLRSTPKKNIFPSGTSGSQAKQETNGLAVAYEKYSFQLGDPVWAKMKVHKLFILLKDIYNKIVRRIGCRRLHPLCKQGMR